MKLLGGYNDLAKIMFMSKCKNLGSVRDSVLITDYERTKILPDIDVLLDWRNRLYELKETDKYPKEWYEREIKATDYLLSKYSL